MTPPAGRGLKLYRPGNSSEGECFMEDWCANCIHDKAFRDGDGEGCPIIARTLIHDTFDPEYPTEWQYDKDGMPFCTAFAAIKPRWSDKRTYTTNDPRQLPLI